MKVQKGFVLRELAGEYVIISTGAAPPASGGLLTVNEVGAELWEMLQTERSLEELVWKILEEYDVEEKTAREDIQEFLDTLNQRGMLETNGCQESIDRQNTEN